MIKFWLLMLAATLEGWR